MTIFIFFAHSKSDYKTEYERLCLEKIRSEFPDSIIINPWDIIKDIPKKELKKLSFWEIENLYFFPEIEKSSIVIVAKCWSDLVWRGRYTPGVIAEIEYAKKLEKKILEFSN